MGIGAKLIFHSLARKGIGLTQRHLSNLKEDEGFSPPPLAHFALVKIGG
jgi:hypothetical protein